MRVIHEIWESIIEMIADKVVDSRLYRWKPRVRKKRTKSFSYLAAPGVEYKQYHHR